MNITIPEAEDNSGLEPTITVSPKDFTNPYLVTEVKYLIIFPYHHFVLTFMVKTDIPTLVNIIIPRTEDNSGLEPTITVSPKDFTNPYLVTEVKYLIIFPYHHFVLTFMVKTDIPTLVNIIIPRTEDNSGLEPTITVSPKDFTNPYLVTEVKYSVLILCEAFLFTSRTESLSIYLKHVHS